MLHSVELMALRAIAALLLVAVLPGCRDRPDGVTHNAIDRTATPDPDAPPGTLSITAAGHTTVLDAAQLDALPPLAGQGHKGGGWDLRDVIAAAGVRGAATITAVGREGSATVDTAMLGPGVRGTIRRNRRGELRLGIEYADPDAGTSVIVHAISRLDVVTAVPPKP